MTLYVHRSERADGLVLGLARLLAVPLADVFAEEVVAVPARGIERWLQQRLSHDLGADPGRGDGVCAGIRFLSPATLVAEVLGVGDTDPWSPDRLVWPLLEVIDEVGGEPWCAALGAHLGYRDVGPERSNRQGRRFAVARRLAGLFHSYATSRPQVLSAWAAGENTDGWGVPLAGDLAWQSQLWRLLRDRVGGPDPVARWPAAAAADLSLPPRISLFGPTRLPAAHRAVLTAVARTRDVHLWLTHPSPGWWSQVESLSPAVARGPIRRREDATLMAARHPLAASLGRESRELQLVLPAEFVDLHHQIEPRPPSLLGALQQDIAADRIPAVFVPGADGSVQVHACHGPSRQVEVLREVLVGLLAQDPSLEPRDILVMCPDVDTYAPLIAANFGLADAAVNGHPAHRLRVRLADRALRQTNPLLAVAARLLELAGTRLTVSQVLDLAGDPPVRRRFHFDDDELATVERWLAESGVRWGLDAAHREAFGLRQVPANTWKVGLDRILTGVAMAPADENWFGSTLPLDDIGSSDVDLAGTWAELIDRLGSILDSLEGPQPVGEWLSVLREGVLELTAVTETERWQLVQLQREFGAVVDEAGGRAATIELRLADIRALLAGRLAGRPTRANFRTGTLTVCTMVPMRSVPHRVVCLLGLDDGVFPRRAWVDGDDVLGRDPAVGERDARAEDRQLFLDAIMAATDRLVITYTGADPRSGEGRPPAVPLGELLDVLDIMTAASVPGSIVVRHPLQPFDSRGVTPAALGVPGPFSFDPAALAGATAAAQPRQKNLPWLDGPLPPLESPVVDLSGLVAFVGHPAAAFFRQRLGIALTFENARRPDSLTVELTGLQRWEVARRLLADRLSGLSEDRCRELELRRGALPPGPLGTVILDELLVEMNDIVVGTIDLRSAPPRTEDVMVALPDGREIRGTVAGIHGRRITAISHSILSARHRLRRWTELLVLTAARPDTAWTAVTVGRGAARPRRADIPALDPKVARNLLGQLVDLYDRGLREPLPLLTSSSAEYAAARRAGRNSAAAEFAAGRVFSEEFGEHTEEAVVRVWGPNAPLTALLAAAPLNDERWAGEPHRFGELALRLWSPLLEREVVAPL